MSPAVRIGTFFAILGILIFLLGNKKTESTRQFLNAVMVPGIEKLANLAKHRDGQDSIAFIAFDCKACRNTDAQLRRDCPELLKRTLWIPICSVDDPACRASQSAWLNLQRAGASESVRDEFWTASEWSRSQKFGDKSVKQLISQIESVQARLQIKKVPVYIVKDQGHYLISSNGNELVHDCRK